MVPSIHFYILDFRREKMQDKTKNRIIAIGFILILIIIFFSNILIKDKQVSISERRKLTQFPKITFKNIVDGKVTQTFEKYATDQFLARDFFRSVKAFNSIEILKQKDNNKLFEKEGAIYKIEYPLNTNNVKKSAAKINAVCDRYLKNNHVYYAIIPDKNYYLKNDDHLKMDYNELQKIMKNEIKNMQYIDISNSLRLEDFYKTDLHWRQENLQKVVNTIQNGMNLEKNAFQIQYDKIDVGDFYGVYYGQLGIKVSPDKMYILSNQNIENCITYNYETKKSGKIYDKKPSSDKYDIYLSGATPLITIKNPNANNNKELLLFRDSFGSSLAPLLVENYSKITLIDLRYISSQLLDQYIQFENQDVLFLYSTLILNQDILK